jgi:hypothetical protein
MGAMTDREIVASPVASVEEIQQGWHELMSRVGQLESERLVLQHENKSLRLLLERVIDHRQKTHSELVIILTSLVTKLPLNDIGGVISRLVEHNTNVTQFLAALAKGTTDLAAPQPVLLKQLDQTKRDLTAAVKPLVEELLSLDPPLEKEMLQAVAEKPEMFFSPGVVRANRCFIKGYLPRERIVREFGESYLAFFNDMTTDSIRNPYPKREEIALGFRSDFEDILAHNPSLPLDKRQGLIALHQKVQRSKSASEARLQRNVFQKLSFIIELLHYYEHQNTEAPDAVFAMSLPGLLEQLVLSASPDSLDEKLIAMAEGLLAYVASPDHRLMVINNIGKSGGVARTLRFVLRLRAVKVLEDDPEQIIPEFIKHLIPTQKPPPAQALAAVLRLVGPEAQRAVVKALMRSDRIGHEAGELLCRELATSLGLQGLVEEVKAQASVSPEVERKNAWAKVKEMLLARSDAAMVAAAIRARLNAKYDSEEIHQSWIILTETDPMSLIRVFCQIPYLPNGRTDPIAKTVLETYVTRLTHEKYAGIYHKVVTSLRNIFRAKPDSPTLLNFLALVRWASPEAADRLCADVGMQAPAAI